MADDHINALPKGHRLQEYELVRVLGHGGFGITYLGYDHNLDKAVAVKEYLPVDLAGRTTGHSVVPQTEAYRADFAWGQERFLDEARTLARFAHRNIVQVHRFFEAHDTAYIVMEYAEGETLAERLKRQGTLDEGKLKAILLPLLDGLAQVHAAGVLHRDIKPGNIMLREADGSPVLVDFGSARQAIGERSRSMTAVVTPGYGPIEQYSSRGKQGPWTDLYALGGVCYRALTGNAPAEATERVRNDPQASAVEAGSSKAAPAFLQAVDWALQVNEDDRPQDAATWRAALLGEKNVPAGKTPTPTKVKHPATQPQAPGSSPFRQRWAIASVVALSLAGLGWWNWQTYQAAEEARQSAEAERQATEEAKRIAEAERQAAESRRKAEAKRQAAEARRKAEAEKQAAEARQKAEAERQAAEARRKAEAERQAAEARRKAEVERQAAEARRKAEKVAPDALFSLLEKDNVSVEAVHDLIARGAYVNAKNERGATPLHFAAANNENPEIVQALLDGGAYVHAKAENGLTPLHQAAGLNENPGVIVALLDSGADVNAGNKNGYTPLHQAAGSNRNSGVIKALLAAGADVHAKTYGGWAPLHVAAEHSLNPEIIQALLDGGADVHAKSENGLTPLHQAARRNENPEITQALLNGGADVNAKDLDGETPLHEAARRNENPEITQALLDGGADVNANTNIAKTPLDLARANKNWSAVKVLEEVSR